MNEDMATTPFGGGQVVARQFLRRRQVSERQARLAETGQTGARAGADKWQLLRSLTEAKLAYDLSDRSIAVLEALLSFHPERLLDGARPLIVFPSNQQLSLRTRGMSPATIRRHLAALVDAGLIFRRDSPNGKRYCRRDAEGAPKEMFGFDLAPLALAADAIHAKAQAVHAEERQRQALRGEVTLHLRDIAKMLQAALNEQRAGDWTCLEASLRALSGRVARNATIASLTERRNSLLRLRAKVENAYLTAIAAAEMSTCACEFEHHIQKSESDQTHESAVEKGELVHHSENRTNNGEAQPERGDAATDRRGETISLPRILAACPQIADYSRCGIGTWSDFLRAVALVRAMLKISPAAWNTACAAMGEIQASIAVAAMLERADRIRSPGGYLRTLATKATAGKFAVMPMMKALEQTAERHRVERNELV
ncbi:MAG TPA: plasmid replication protein RepC [Ensifer sp.]|nr:plasmid replication protein RepC [Ensifer sp.]